MGAGGGRLARWERALLLLIVGALVGMHVGDGVLLDRTGATLFGSDEQFYYASLRSLVFDRDVDFANELHELTPHPEQVPIEVSPTGRVLNVYPVGWALVALPLYGSVRVARAVLGVGREDTGYEPPYQLAATLSQVLAAGMGLVLAHLALRRFFPAWPAVAGLGLVLVGSPLLFYAVHGVHMAHAASFFSVSLYTFASLQLWQQHRQGPGAYWRWWALLGLAAGLMLVTRYSNLVFAPIGLLAVVPFFGVGADASSRRPMQGLLRGIAISLAVALPVVGIQSLYWTRIFGEWFVLGGYGEFDWLAPQVGSYLFSHRHGVVFFSPVTGLALLGLFGVLVRPSRVPRIVSGCILASVTGLVLLNSAWHIWWFGHGFGARSFVEASGLLAFGLAGLLAVHSKMVVATTLAIAAAGVVWTNSLLLLQLADRLANDGSTTFSEILRAMRDVLHALLG